MSAVDRAAEAIRRAEAEVFPGLTYEEAAHTVFASIDVDALARAINALQKGGGRWHDLTPRIVAETGKAHLLSGESR